jgi:RNA polymerase primary sigma factor
MSYEAALCVQRLKALGRKKGFLTYADINLQVPSRIVDPDELAAIVEQLQRFGIRILENPPSDRP